MAILNACEQIMGRLKRLAMFACVAPEANHANGLPRLLPVVSILVPVSVHPVLYVFRGP